LNSAMAAACRCDHAEGNLGASGSPAEAAAMAEFNI
jgi:hypothetical protein